VAAQTDPSSPHEQLPRPAQPMATSMGFQNSTISDLDNIVTMSAQTTPQISNSWSADDLNSYGFSDSWLPLAKNPAPSTDWIPALDGCDTSTTLEQPLSLLENHMQSTVATTEYDSGNRWFDQFVVRSAPLRMTCSFLWPFDLHVFRRYPL
jgi:hypothetical protein